MVRHLEISMDGRTWRVMVRCCHDVVQVDFRIRLDVPDTHCVAVPGWQVADAQGASGADGVMSAWRPPRAIVRWS